MIIEKKDFLFEPWFQSYLKVFENSLDSIVITSTSPEEHFLYVNESFKKKTGYCEEELFQKSPRILQGKLTNRNVLDTLKEKLKNGEDFIGQTTNYRKDGTPYVVKWFISALKDLDNNTIAYFSFQKEVTQTLWDSKKLNFLSSIINQIEQLILVTDLTGKIVFVNELFCRKTAYNEEEILNQNVRVLKSGKHTDDYYKKVWDSLLKNESFHDVFINKDKFGNIFFEQKAITPIKNEDGEVEFYASIGHDVTKLINEKDALELQAYKDTLTGLYNRLKLDIVINQKLKDFSKYQHLFSFILIDIDHFKTINDTYGHDIGDEILVSIASTLKSSLRKDDFICRWGGEEFVVILDLPIDVSITIAKTLKKEVEFSQNKIGKTITISVGITEVKNNDNFSTIFKRVDEYLYKAKNSGRNRIISDETISEQQA